MKKLSQEEIKTIQLDILKYIDFVCKNNNIKYFINYGTLLGSVRHKGFIPWDDDIDISMYREDYEKLIKTIKKENHPKYKVININNSDWYFHNFSIIVDITTTIPDKYKKFKQDTHLFVDIFPVDKFNDTSFIKKIAIISSIRSISQTKLKYIYSPNKIKNILKKLCWFLLYFTNPRLFAKIIEKVILKNTNNNGKYEAFLGMGDFKEILPAGTCSKSIDLEFENTLLKAPKNYDIILTSYYGDYLKLPPKEECVPPHNFEAYKI